MSSSIAKCPSCGSDRIGIQTRTHSARPMSLFGTSAGRCLDCGDVFFLSEESAKAALSSGERGLQLGETARCPSCGYNLNLQETGNLCPECGTTIPSESQIAFEITKPCNSTYLWLAYVSGAASTCIVYNLGIHDARMGLVFFGTFLLVNGISAVCSGRIQAYSFWSPVRTGRVATLLAIVSVIVGLLCSILPFSGVIK